MAVPIAGVRFGHSTSRRRGGRRGSLSPRHDGPTARVPSARLLGAARLRLGHDRLPYVDKSRSEHD